MISKNSIGPAREKKFTKHTHMNKQQTYSDFNWVATNLNLGKCNKNRVNMNATSHEISEIKMYIKQEVIFAPFTLQMSTLKTKDLSEKPEIKITNLEYIYQMNGEWKIIHIHIYPKIFHY